MPAIFVVLELFTSEGCSSCPPADRVLADIAAHDADVIALSLHVDYWNSLGWRDPFSAAAYSQRQQDYARALKADTYTPALVVDGARMVPARSPERVTAAIATARAQQKERVTLAAVNTAQGMEVVANGAFAGRRVVFAITEGQVSSQVTRGENAGATLAHSNVVRTMLQGRVDGIRATATLKWDPEWQKPAVVVLVSDAKTLRIVGAARLAL